MLEECKASLRDCADKIPNWRTMSKNDLCREYIKNEGNETLQNAYFSAIVYRYWNLISKYYYMSSNVATVEDCYEWLVDSVYGCLKATSWDNPNTSIYNDPNGPDKVINRCMKCARLTYYQFINRKKRKDNFGMLSIDELMEEFGNTFAEPEDTSYSDKTGEWAIHDYVRLLFARKDYFAAILIDCIIHEPVFDTQDNTSNKSTQLNMKKLTKLLSELPDEYISNFSKRYSISEQDVRKGISYFTNLRPTTIKAKIQTVLERLQHDSFCKMLKGDK